MVQWHQRRPVKTAVAPEELARRYRDGASLDDLGVLCGCSGKRIRRILVAQGVEIRPRGYNTAIAGRTSLCAAETGRVSKLHQTYRLISRRHHGRASSVLSVVISCRSRAASSPYSRCAVSSRPARSRA